jgi:hypothetical protein
MGNPASVKRKKTEKRRKRYELRLGPGVYLPKEEREVVNTAVAKAEAEAKVRAEQLKKEREAKKKVKPAKPTAEKAEKPAEKGEKAEKPAVAPKEEKK